LDDIDNLRREIAEIDAELFRLIARRSAVAGKIGGCKVANSLPIRNTAVEEEVMERYRTLAERSDVDPSTAEEIARTLIREAVDVQSRLSVPSEPSRVLVIGGAGKMGSWLCRYFAGRGHRVLVHDVVPGEFPTVPLEEGLSESDIVVVATPIPVVKETIEKVFEQGYDGTVFDIASIKSPVSDLLRRRAREGRRVCSVHPMFGPDAKSMFDRNVIVCDCGSAEAVDDACQLFEGVGANITVMDLGQHDELMAMVLGLGHTINLAFLRAVTSSGFDRETLERAASTTFRRQMETCRDVALENPELYFDIQYLNPHARDAFDLLLSSLQEIRRTVEEGDREAFARVMEEGRRYFGGQ